MHSTSRPIRISIPQAETSSQGWSQVSAEVDGTRVFFSSPDVELDPNPEAFGCAFLVPALIAQRPLEFSAPVSREWKESAARVMELLKGWWGYKPVPIIAPEAPIPTLDSARKAGLFFSGGVDAFHALLHAGPVDALIFVHGFDMWLNEKASLAARKQEAEMRRIATARNMKAILVRTTVRAHALLPFRLRSQTGGSVMAAIAHLLRRELCTIRVASSCELDAATLPWGTHPDLDPLWGAGSLRIEHFGAEISRTEKVRLIASDPEVRRSLRVCWRPTETSLNCCRCEKCLHTILLFEHAGVPERISSLNPPEPIANLIDRLGPTSEYRLRYWSDEFVTTLSPEVAEAVKRFAARTRRKIALEKHWLGRAYLRISQKLGT